MEYIEIEAGDRRLIEAAVDVIRKNYRKERHTVGAAVLCASGKIYSGVNVDSCGYGPCAEPIAIGTAISNGEREFLTIVAVGAANKDYPVLSPCGNCRQFLLDYAPDAMVILERDGRLVKARVRDLLPAPYLNFDDD